MIAESFPRNSDLADWNCDSQSKLNIMLQYLNKHGIPLLHETFVPVRVMFGSLETAIGRILIYEGIMAAVDLPSVEH